MAEKAEKKNKKTSSAEKVTKQSKKDAKSSKTSKENKKNPSKKSDQKTSNNEVKIAAGEKRKGTSTGVVFALGLAILMSGAGLGLSIYNYTRSGNSILNFNNSAQFKEGSIADVANRVSKSVVSILTETRTTTWYGQDSTSTAAGTGMIVSSDGYVLTNKHVVDGAKHFKIILDNGTSYSDVTLVGTDPLNDVAFLKIKNVSDLAPVTLGDSKTLSVGQQVITIGNALGQYQNSVASGIISGTGRSLVASDGTSSGNYERLSDMIQTDAAINSGNSGGPLVNAAGEVVGINTATTASANNIGFAIPISSIKGMLKSVLNNNGAERAYIGVSYLPITNDVKDTYNLSVDHGAYLASSESVISGSPAEKAGLKSKDIIVAINGVEIGKAGSLSTLIGEYAVGEKIDIKYLRDGKEYTAQLTLEAYKITGQQS